MLVLTGLLIVFCDLLNVLAVRGPRSRLLSVGIPRRKGVFPTKEGVRLGLDLRSGAARLDGDRLEDELVILVRRSHVLRFVGPTGPLKHEGLLKGSHGLHCLLFKFVVHVEVLFGRLPGVDLTSVVLEYLVSDGVGGLVRVIGVICTGRSELIVRVVDVVYHRLSPSFCHSVFWGNCVCLRSTQKCCSHGSSHWLLQQLVSTKQTWSTACGVV